MKQEEIECKGCRMYNRYMSNCEIGIIPHVSKTKHCPCINCLLKMICNDACKEYQKYSKLILPDNVELYRNTRSDRITDGHFVKLVGV